MMKGQNLPVNITQVRENKPRMRYSKKPLGVRRLPAGFTRKTEQIKKSKLTVMELRTMTDQQITQAFRRAVDAAMS